MYVPRNRIAELAADPPPDADGASLEGAGVRCPGDGTLMSRTRVNVRGSDGAVYLDRCASCLGVWFDAGEWNALASARLLDQLDELWTAEWRSRQRREAERQEYEARVRETFGPELYERLLSVAHELRSHPRRSQALAILREESETH
jgi:Zn-finger nucleic acid-binding protein